MPPFTRERFRQICHGERLGDFGILGNGFHYFYPETLKAWLDQGASKVLELPGPPFGNEMPVEVMRYLGFDASRILWEVHSGMNGGTAIDSVADATFQDEAWLVEPPIGPILVEDGEKDIIVINRSGMKEKVLKATPFHSMPMWLEHPVKDRATWNQFKARLDPDSPGRYPADWSTYVEQVNALDCPVGLEVGGFFGFMNMWVGTESLMYMFYDDPVLIEEMMETMLHLETEIVKRVTKDISIDFAFYWEDMAYNSGPMISPAMMRKHMLPRYRQLNQVIRDAGCDIFYLDSDGNVDLLIPIWLEAGIKLIWPLETAAGMDPVALRRQYGKDIILGGGLNRLAFYDKAALKNEVMSKVPHLAATGPYFPSPDHTVPPGVPFENFCYYINLLREIRGDQPLDF